MMCVNLVCLHAYVCYCSSALDSNDPECTEEGETFEYQEEGDQGQAKKGKPSILDAYLNPIHLLCRLHKGLLNCMFLYCYRSCSNYIDWLKLHKPSVIILRDDPLEYLLFIPAVVAY
jgi:hypothetical protein